MKTATHASSPRCRLPGRVLAAFVVAGLMIPPAHAVNPPPDQPAAGASALVAADPYLAFLESLDTRSATCREQSTALRGLLAERERLTRTFLRANTVGRADLIPALAELERRIEQLEVSLETSMATTEPGDAPNLAPLPVVDIEAIREQSKRWRKPMYLPMPPPLVIPDLPAPSHEAVYLDYLNARAGKSTFAQDLVKDVMHLLRERRELAYRHLHTRAHERARLEATVRAVSLHIRVTAEAIVSGATISDW